MESAAKCECFDRHLVFIGTSQRFVARAFPHGSGLPRVAWSGLSCCPQHEAPKYHLHFPPKYQLVANIQFIHLQPAKLNRQKKTGRQGFGGS
jgi:hypothetical protein